MSGFFSDSLLPLLFCFILIWILGVALYPDMILIKTHMSTCVQTRV